MLETADLKVRTTQDGGPEGPHYCKTADRKVRKPHGRETH